MSFTTIDPLPPAPARTMSPDDFIAYADAFVAALPTLRNQINTVMTELAAAAAIIGAAPAYADPELLALTGNTPAADKVPYFTGSSASALATLTAFARTLIDDPDAATMRTTLGLGTAATTASTAYDASGAASSAVSTHAALSSGVHGFTSTGVSLTTAASAAAALAAIGGIYVAACSLASSGYVHFKGGILPSAGLLIQWAQVSVNPSSATSFSWPIAFPTAVFGALPGSMSGLSSSGSLSVYISSGTLTTSGASVWGNNGASTTTTAFVIGVGN